MCYKGYYRWSTLIAKNETITKAFNQAKKNKTVTEPGQKARKGTLVPCRSSEQLVLSTALFLNKLSSPLHDSRSNLQSLMPANHPISNPIFGIKRKKKIRRTCDQSPCDNYPISLIMSLLALLNSSSQFTNNYVKMATCFLIFPFKA